MTDRRTVDLNADLAEGFPWDLDLLDRVTSASLACGAHAGDAATVRRALQAARERGVTIGAHPGYPDRQGFGRRVREDTGEAIRGMILDQVAWLRGIAEPLGAAIRYVKPHGALYLQAQEEEGVAIGVLDAVAELGLPVVGMPGLRLERLARERGIRLIAEGFADRGYGPDGRLLPRNVPGALTSDPEEMATQIGRLLDSGIDTLCLHGDNPNAVEFADRIRALLDRLGVRIRGFAT